MILASQRLAQGLTVHAAAMDQDGGAVLWGSATTGEQSEAVCALIHEIEFLSDIVHYRTGATVTISLEDLEKIEGVTEPERKFLRSLGAGDNLKNILVPAQCGALAGLLSGLVVELRRTLGYTDAEQAELMRRYMAAAAHVAPAHTAS